MADRSFDPRLTPARADLAAKRLEGKVEAARFVEGALQEVIDPVAPVRGAPRPDASLLTEALKGERVAVYETVGEGWSWGQLETDGYVGYLPANALMPPGPQPTHRVKALRTLSFPGPDIKLPPSEMLSLGVHVAVMRTQGPFAVTPSGFIPSSHLMRADEFETDFVAVAERFVGAPYIWGGKSSLGLDCSGLVQLSLAACGTAAPRDSDMQERNTGVSIAVDESLSNVRRGDLIFWKGHVAIARDAATLSHANAFHMSVAIEPIAEVVARARETGNAITSVRRVG
jgi:hypothetical protein